MRRRVEGCQRGRPTACTSNLPDHIDQCALGDYTIVTYINIKQGDNKNNGEKLDSWVLDR